MLKAVREGDVVHVHSLDSLARNLNDLMALLGLASLASLWAVS